jgi:hypothetical protein
MTDRCCETCKHWHDNKTFDGWCDLIRWVKMRWDNSCGQWEKRDE